MTKHAGPVEARLRLVDAPAVSELIEAVYGVRLTVRNMGKYLKRWGFTPQRPLKKAYEQNSAVVDKWVNEEYPQIAKAAKTESA